ncbi:MAG: preprotein translocase subunit SecE [Candidatus Izemoplasmatales bacterium]|nr:preprotein translocase subunit SecE [Candidatus Izemoplasmatales bacterium]MDD4069285.1 preprotein translocase subunit SecE [Candidatus Izemoplasmatales bacterium]MDY0139471.1 preprotein translocase subunit SecE [Candidatus Izemoplasmatales bacterium]
MAKENKKPTVAKAPKNESKVMAILKKEYKFENWLLAVLSPVLILYGVYIVIGKFGSASPTLAESLGNSGIGIIDFFFNTPLKRILTGVFLILIGTLVLVYLMIPYIKPSITEMKKVNWPSGKDLATNSGRVFSFLLFLMLIFFLYGLILDPLFKSIYGA